MHLCRYPAPSGSKASHCTTMTPPPPPPPPPAPPTTFVVGISGLSSTGKTTLSRLLRALLQPRAFIVHQDDFFHADGLVPQRAGGLQDWDCAEAIDWARLVAALDRVRASGALPADLESLQDASPVDAAGAERSRVAADTMLRLQRKLSAAATGVASVAIVDGFLMLHEHSPVEPTMDAKILLRVPRDTVRWLSPPPPPASFVRGVDGVFLGVARQSSVVRRGPGTLPSKVRGNPGKIDCPRGRC